MGLIRFIFNERGLWSAASTAAELELEYHASGGGVSGYCSGSEGSKLIRCRAYIKSFILRAQNCNAFVVSYRSNDLVRVVTLHATVMASGSLTYLMGCGVYGTKTLPHLI